MANVTEFFALYDRNMVIRTDGSPLKEQDLLLLKSEGMVADLFTEPSTGIMVAGMKREAAVPAEANLLPAGYQWSPIRSHFAELGVENSFSLARAKALMEWRQRTRYCGRCGTLLEEDKQLTARRCPECGNLIFPRIEPCIIVLVNRGDEILLARHVQRNQNIYACIAGFMEAGETAEQAVAREIKEETGIDVKNIRYFGSQSWPFPSQLMLGFTAEYAGGELKLQEDEIEEARWFRRDDCPASPPPGSIAYRLIHNAEQNNES